MRNILMKRQNLKKARKDAREYVIERHRLITYISFNKNYGYYHNEFAGNDTVYICDRSGKLEEYDSLYAKRFFRNKKEFEKKKLKQKKKEA